MGKEIFTVNLPDIGEGVVEGEVIEWLKEVGDPVSQDEPVVVVMTDKATVELPAPCPGTLFKCYFEVGEVAVCQKPLYDIERKGEEEKKQEPPPFKKEAVSIERAAPHSTGLATPHTRRLAKELGLELSQVAGSGKEGRVTKEDLVKHISTPAVTPLCLESDRVVPLIGIQRQMAHKMQESLTIPSFSYFERVEVFHLVQMREKFKEKGESEEVAVTFLPFFIRALSLTLQKFPEINSSLDMAKEALYQHRMHNVGVAVHTEKGLIVPVLKNVEAQPLPELIRTYDQLMLRMRKGQLKATDMQEATITISNFGAVKGSGLWATPIIVPPQVAIVAISRIHKAPVIVNDALVIRDVVTLSGSFDHRVIEGEVAVEFFHLFAHYLHNPAMLL